MDLHHTHGLAARRGQHLAKAAFFDPLDYPFSRPRGSYVIGPGRHGVRRAHLAGLAERSGLRHAGHGAFPALADPTLVTASGVMALRGRIAVIAAGSNGAPEQLQRKFAAMGIADPIAVMAAEIHGLVPVYSAHFAHYGALPATLHAEQGAVSALHVKFVTPRQLAVLNASEAPGINYRLVTLPRLRIDFGNGFVLRSACFYRSLHGAFALEGAPVRLAGTPARRSQLASADQADILRRAAAHLGYDVAPADLAARLAGDAALRLNASGRLPRILASRLLPRAIPVR